MSESSAPQSAAGPSSPASCTMTAGDVQQPMAEDILFVVRFGPSPEASGGDPRLLHLPLDPLQPARPTEIWTGSGTVESGRAGEIAFARNPDLLYARFSRRDVEARELDHLTDEAYRHLYDFLGAQGYRYPLRVWNYFNDIHLQQDGLDRYQAFCVGRHRALGEELDNTLLPAATVIGTRQAGLHIYVLATRSPGVQIENPRQVSAFRYPSRYGPRSPSFSRAVLKRWGNDAHLYISGTASIVGHETLHPGDAIAQLDETLENLLAVILEARRQGGPALEGIAELSLMKVYVRDPADLARVEDHLQRRLGPAPPRIFLQGDICRRDLMLEIEALYTGPGRRHQASA